VLAAIEGADPRLKNEWVVLSAHPDHNGVAGDTIFHGADDNGSGAVARLAIAEAYAKAAAAGQRPKRSVLFAAFNSEERGPLMGADREAGASADVGPCPVAQQADARDASAGSLGGCLRAVQAAAGHASKIDAKNGGMSIMNGAVAPTGCHVSVPVRSSGRSSTGAHRSKSRASRSTIT
jgi:peptidase M28-like protein